MKIRSISLKKFKRFEDLTIKNIPDTARLIVLTGPNGSGKSSLFEGFNFSSRRKRGQTGFDSDYHARYRSDNEQAILKGISIEFHDRTGDNDPKNDKKAFYIRSAYRHEADFTAKGISSTQDALDSINSIDTLMQLEKRISENYNRIVGEAVKELFNGLEPGKTKIEIRDRLIGQIRTSMIALFDDLIFSGPGNPTSGGTFRFKKGKTPDFHFKNLSGGEKAAFDLLLDFIVKKEAFSNTIFCIDEPELHMHTKLQGRLLQQLFELLPEKCQLWISTHSIGMARKAAELDRANPGEVVFIDFHDQNFDQAVTLTPTTPTRAFWKNMFDTALDDLSQLVVPAKVIFCEGKRLGLGGRKPAFDVAIYSAIFSATHADTDFVALGGTSQVQSDGKLSGALLKKLAPGIETWMIFDRDDRSDDEIQKLQADGIKVLGLRDLENYLWEDEILIKLAKLNGHPAAAQALIDEKSRLLKSLAACAPKDDIKAISGQLYNFCKTRLTLTQCGNDAEAFAISTLAPLITADTQVYRQLQTIIFGANV